MTQMELVDTLREKTGCSYSEARAAMDAAGEDLLECLCWLENHGKGLLVGTSCSTEDREPPKEEPPREEKKSGPMREGLHSLWDGLVGLVRKCNETEIIMTSKKGRRELSIPLTLFIILLLVAYWAVLGALVIALFFGCRFSISGTLHNEDVNEVLGKATDFAEDIKEGFSDKNE